MSIQTEFDLVSKDLFEIAKNEGWWNGKDLFHWQNVIGEASRLPSTKLTTPQERYCAGKNLLEKHSQESK